MNQPQQQQQQFNQMGGMGMGQAGRNNHRRRQQRIIKTNTRRRRRRAEDFPPEVPERKTDYRLGPTVRRESLRKANVVLPVFELVYEVDPQVGMKKAGDLPAWKRANARAERNVASNH